MKLSIKIHILLITLLLLSIGLKAQKLDIRIFTDTKLNEISFIPSFGRYFVEIDNKKQSINKSDIVRIKTQADKVSLYINDSLIGNYKELKFSSEGLMSFFLLRTKDTNLIKDRRYDDNLIVKVKNKDLFLINNIETESYIAGVVQAETWGATTNVDFFKLQAICVRNYLFKNLNKHKAEGFHLCDGVHCQAYKGRANQVEVIQGAYNSKGEIIVDSLGNIIETVFHSNSGGQTVNSEDVWGKPFSHLVGKIDSFSVGTKAYQWEKYIKIRDWKRYFREKGVNIKNDSIEKELLNFSQKDGRKKEMLGVPLVQIRKDFGLRSTFFDCQEWGSEVRLNGRGYGHGVGLSQEGAINMCNQGYEYWQVIEHYYSGARIKRLDDDIIINTSK